LLRSVQYTLRTESLTNELLNAEVTYHVTYDQSFGIAYEVVLRTPSTGPGSPVETDWHAKIVNRMSQERFEYDLLQRIYYRTRQTIRVESALYQLQEDLQKFLNSEGLETAEPITMNGRTIPGGRLNTLTIWYDPDNLLPLRRVNLDRGNVIRDEFTYTSINEDIPAFMFDLPKPPEAIADFDLYPEPPTLPRFENVAETPVDGVYVQTLLAEIRRFVIMNQWEYGPFSTIVLPWLTDMPVAIYRGRTAGIVPPLVTAVDIPEEGRAYFTLSYDYLGYVVTGYVPPGNGYNLTDYEQIPVQAVLRLEEFVPLYATPSPEKSFVVENFIKSVQSNDFFIQIFEIEGRAFDLVIKNFSFHENEGYLLLNVYGKEYWDNANIEAMFNFVVTGDMADAHTTPTIIYALNTMKRLGIFRELQMPVFQDFPDIVVPQ
jgi:hypothetical protein